MSTFDTFTPPTSPSPGTTRSVEPTIRMADFPGGYAQRLPSGINHMLENAKLIFANVTAAEAEAMCAFFTSKRGYLPFWYTMPGDEPKKWICTEWSKSPRSVVDVDVIATFQEVVDP